RREDIPLLVTHLLRRHAAVDRLLAERFFPDGDPRNVPRVSPVLMKTLVQHPYTMHVRELDAILLRAALESRGRYVELSPDAPRAPPPAPVPAPAPVPVPTPAPVQAPAPAPPARELDAFAPEERARLVLLRTHGFRTAVCGRDPAYPGNRQTADFHM